MSVLKFLKCTLLNVGFLLINKTQLYLFISFVLELKWYRFRLKPILNQAVINATLSWQLGCRIQMSQNYRPIFYQHILGLKLVQKGTFYIIFEYVDKILLLDFGTALHDAPVTMTTSIIRKQCITLCNDRDIF